MGAEFLIMVEKLKLDRLWLKKNGTPITTCGECGRMLTEKEFEEHKKRRALDA